MGTRDVILDAAAEVMRSRGLAKATTKEIARASGFSEATLYKHFADKAALLVAVLRERSPVFVTLTRNLEDQAGQDTVLANLTGVAEAAIAFYQQGFPMMASIFSDPDILNAHREAMSRQTAGPHKANLGVTAYLEAERTLGRIRADADTTAAAGLLLGACFQYAFLSHMALPAHPGRPAPEAAEAFAHTLLPALLP
jgi:AcrR family transcriptional regulator